jgi:hypothetical protein
MAYMMRIAWLVIAAIAVTAGFYVYVQHQRLNNAEKELGINTSRVLTAVFSQSNELRVGRLRGAVLAKSECNSLKVFENSQRVIAPYTMDYTVDLKKILQSSYRWNADDRILTIKIPDVELNAPSIDMANARFRQSGLYISRSCGVQMQKLAAKQLAEGVERKAGEEEYIGKVRESSRKAVERFVSGPLKAVGFNDVHVVVQLPNEQKPETLTHEQWDISRSIADVFADVH